MRLFKCITGLVSENPLAVNVLTSRRNFYNLHESTFILSFLHPEPNCVRKSCFQSDLRFYYCLLTRWLETTSILVVIEITYRYKLKLNYRKNHRLFAIFYFIFGIYMKFPVFWIKYEAHRSSISEVIDSEKCAYLNA